MAGDYRTLPFNGQRVRAARLALGLGTRDLARRAGTTWTVINSIEKRNFIASTTTLAEVRRIAGAVGLTVNDIIDAPPEKATPPHDADDTTRLAGLLATDLRLHRRSDIADALGWTLPRLRAAVRDLDAKLRPVGMRVHATSSQYLTLRPLFAQAQDDAEALDRRRVVRYGFITTEGRLMYQALNGELTDKTPHDEKPSLGRLTRLGILRPGVPTEPFSVLSDDARYAFDVADE